MRTSRRALLHNAALAGAAVAGAPLARSSARPGSRWARTRPRASEPLDLLILGGTGFLGPHVVEAALARGHSMTLFNRGRTNSHLFSDLEKLRGDRDPNVGDGLSALEGREWDAVVDTSAYYPRVVEASAGMLADHVKHYVFISTISVYQPLPESGAPESSPLETLDDPTVEEVTGQTYGALKALCEQAAEAAMPGRVANIRPGLIVGPLDSTDRFTYWPVRVSRGGEVLCPGDHRDLVQYIDARDLAEWIVHCIEQRVAGTYNAVCPHSEFGIGELIYGCRAALGTENTFTWVDADFLAEHDVQPWMNMPLWIPSGTENYGMGSVSNDGAYANGLAHRPLADTVRDTLEYHTSVLPERIEQYREARGEEPNEDVMHLRAGLPIPREREVLAAWHAR